MWARRLDPMDCVCNKFFGKELYRENTIVTGVAWRQELEHNGGEVQWDRLLKWVIKNPNRVADMIWCERWSDGVKNWVTNWSGCRWLDDRRAWPLAHLKLIQKWEDRNTEKVERRRLGRGAEVGPDNEMCPKNGFEGMFCVLKKMSVIRFKK